MEAQATDLPTRKRLRVGDRVRTCKGLGEVQGFEFPVGHRLRRAIVRLDDPSRWAIQGSDPGFFVDDVERVEA